MTRARSHGFAWCRLGFYQGGRFEDALGAARVILQERPNDLATQNIAERSLRYIEEEGGCALTAEQLAAWTGVEKMDEK